MRTFRGLLYKMLYLNEAKNYTLSRNKSLASEENPTLFFLEIVGFLAMFKRNILYNRLLVTFVENCHLRVITTALSFLISTDDRNCFQ